MRMIKKENGNLPSAMFNISDVQLNDNGNELSDHRKTTTISLKELDDLNDFNKAQHD